MTDRTSRSGSLRERLADYAHSSWSRWMRYLFSQCRQNEDGTVTIPRNKVDRWIRQMNTLYEDLSEKEKDSDRQEADRILLKCKPEPISRLLFGDRLAVAKHVVEPWYREFPNAKRCPMNTINALDEAGMILPVRLDELHAQLRDTECGNDDVTVPHLIEIQRHMEDKMTEEEGTSRTLVRNRIALGCGLIVLYLAVLAGTAYLIVRAL